MKIHTEPSIFLEHHDVVDLTHKRQFSAQIRALRHMGIDHKIRLDGSPAILRSHAEKVLAGGNPSRARIKIQPDWRSINETKKKPGK